MGSREWGTRGPQSVIRGNGEWGVWGVIVTTNN